MQKSGTTGCGRIAARLRPAYGGQAGARPSGADKTARWLTRHQGDARMAALAAWIERDFVDVLVSGPLDPNWPPPSLPADSELAGPLPAPEPWSQDFTTELRGSGLEFGPGHFTQPPGRMEGEDYTWVGGSLGAEGHRIYLTGVTPFRHTLTLR